MLYCFCNRKGVPVIEYEKTCGIKPQCLSGGKIYVLYGRKGFRRKREENVQHVVRIYVDVQIS